LNCRPGETSQPIRWLIAAAQGQLFHNDDTHMRVQSLRQETAKSDDPDQRTEILA
jgi:hypothetical protein